MYLIQHILAWVGQWFLGPQFISSRPENPILPFGDQTLQWTRQNVSALITLPILFSHWMGWFMLISSYVPLRKWMSPICPTQKTLIPSTFSHSTNGFAAICPYHFCFACKRLARPPQGWRSCKRLQILARPGRSQLWSIQSSHRRRGYQTVDGQKARWVDGLSHDWDVWLHKFVDRVKRLDTRTLIQSFQDVYMLPERQCALNTIITKTGA